jgi:predicted O-linked N-acetylglucosamine transferase (SPINDLY family)
MTTLGFKSAVAVTPFQYVNNALSTAAETWTMHDRQALRRRICNSIMFDADAYATAVEDAYVGAWAEWCQQRNAVQPGD